MPLLEQVIACFPHWLHIITDTKNIGRWREWSRQVPRWRRWFAREVRFVRDRKPVRPPLDRLGRGIAVLVGVGVLIKFLEAFFWIPSAPSMPPAMPPPRPSAAVGTVNAVDRGARTATYASRIGDAVRPYIVFSQRLEGNPAAEVTLRLNVDGHIEDFRLTRSSGVNAWDMAVVQAIGRVRRIPADNAGKVPPEMVLVFSPNALATAPSSLPAAPVVAKELP